MIQLSRHGVQIAAQTVSHIAHITSDFAIRIITGSLHRCSLGRRYLLTGLAVAVLAGCSAAPVVVDAEDTAPESTTESVDGLIAAAVATNGERRAQLSLDAIARMEQTGVDRRAELQLTGIDLTSVANDSLRVRLAIALAQYLLDNQQADAAMNLLQTQTNTQVEPTLQSRLELLTADAMASMGQTSAALDLYLEAADTLGLDQDLSNRIWQLLQTRSQDELRELAATASSYRLRGWIELARVYRNDQFSIRSQMNAIEQWQRIWSQHPAVEQPPDALSELESAWETRPRHVALLLPLQEQAGLAIQEGFLGAYYEALQATRDVPTLSVFDTSDALDVQAVYQRAVDAGVDLIIGPLNKEAVNRLQQMDSLPVPTLALNYADATTPGPANLFQFGLAPEDEISQAAATAWRLGHRYAALVTPQTADYQRLQTAFTDTWSELGGRVVSSAGFRGDGDYAEVIQRLMAIDSSSARADRLIDLLPRQGLEFTPRRREDIDFIFLIANPRQGRQIKPTLSFYFAEDLPVFSIPSIYDGLANQGANQDLNGIVFAIEPWLLDPPSDIRQVVSTNLRPAQGPLQRLRALGIDSYRLHARLRQLERGSITFLSGSTGELSLGMFQRIRRQLPTARFENGLAIPFDAEANSEGE